MSRPLASNARALTRTSNAVSVPRRAMRLARRSSLRVGLFMAARSALYRGNATCLFEIEGLRADHAERTRRRPAMVATARCAVLADDAKGAWHKHLSNDPPKGPTSPREQR